MSDTFDPTLTVGEAARLGRRRQQVPTVHKWRRSGWVRTLRVISNVPQLALGNVLAMKQRHDHWAAEVIARHARRLRGFRGER